MGGLNVEGKSDSWDFGLGAGFYLNANRDKWKNWHMYDYVVKELPALLTENFPQLDTFRASIFGHSMGGHGALKIYLTNSRFTFALIQSVSAFAPIVNPLTCPWGHEAFSGYLIGGTINLQEYDASFLLSKFNNVSETILIDQGDNDKFLLDQLQPHEFEVACRKSRNCCKESLILNFLKYLITSLI
ncbi:S-formylglutathione hydrolase-like [Primulina huaijiensis]|uniref:S-formylglutathione hydrolase-like n=1 Tax=Primulina huaijiensis TaxID=1492673 RepID=UPI003CC706E4